VDTVYDATKTMSILPMVVSQGAKYVAILGTAPTLAAADYLAQNNIFCLSSALANTAIENPQHPLIFEDNLSTSDYGPATYYPYFIKDFGVKTIALGNPDSDTGRTFANVVKNTILKYGLPLTIVADEYYTAGTQNFSPMINKMLALNPDMIDLAGAAPGDGALFCKQSGEAGYKGIRATTVTTGDPVASWNVAGAYSTGFFTLGFNGGDPTPMYTAIKNKYYAQWGEGYFQICPYAYEHARQLFKAMEKANSFDVYKVADVYANMTWTGAYGQVGWMGDEPGSPFKIKRIFNVQEPMMKYTTNGKAETWRNEPYPK
jgi:branched-chain amino acid transport system substrate-binding protein